MIFCNNELKKKLAKCGIRLELLEGSQMFMVLLCLTFMLK